MTELRAPVSDGTSVSEFHSGRLLDPCGRFRGPRLRCSATLLWEAQHVAKDLHAQSSSCCRVSPRASEAAGGIGQRGGGKGGGGSSLPGDPAMLKVTSSVADAGEADDDDDCMERPPEDAEEGALVAAALGEPGAHSDGTPFTTA